MNINNFNIKKIVLIFVFFIIIVSFMPVEAQTFLTKDELDYIDKGSIIRAVSMHGGAPIQYADTNGEIKGISREVLEEISNMTGLVFEYHLYDTYDEMINSDPDIVFGIPYNYAPDNMTLSQPFLKTETILYINSSINSNKLDDKKYAAVVGSDLPEGIKEENAIYFRTREASLDAVESGQADYGYGNAYSVAFYTLQKNYKNIITIPNEKESREYCVGFLKNNEILLSIINKSISLIDENHMRTIILKATTQIDRKITFQMIIDDYGIHIFGTIFFVMGILLLSIILNIQAKNQLKIQNERYQILSLTSNEYLYEYYVRTKHLELSKNCIQLFENSDNFNELTDLLKKALINNDFDKAISKIELPVANGEKGVFKSVNSPIYDERGSVYSIIGKLIDISNDEAEKQELIKKSEIDGLTGLYNAATAKRLITESIINTDLNATDALILIDCDKFKEVNDTFGHLEGDNVLVNVSKGLVQTFRETDIIGRIGGDEFCVYMKGVPSVDLVVSKCQKLMSHVRVLNQEYTLSIGIALLTKEKSYDDLFKMADNALYEVKKNSGADIKFSSSYGY